MKKNKKTLSMGILTTLVLSSMLGIGIFSLPQNIAEVAGPSAMLISWGVTGIGVLFLVFSMLLLTHMRPDLENSIFTLAREGFGEMIGFFSAWGYWLCAVVANVSYLVILFSALSFFTDSPEFYLFGNGNTWQAIIGASLLLWLVHWIMLHGVEIAASLNLVTTLAKMVPLTLFIIFAFVTFRPNIFNLDFNGVTLGVPIWKQVKHTMLITLWLFIGIEGAIVVSDRARSKRDVSRATVLAVLIALIIYFLVTLFSFGIVTRPELAEMHNPSVAGLMTKMIGPLGNVVIVAGIIISVCGTYLSWTIMAAEVLFTAATHKSFPRFFTKQNKNDAPSASLWLTDISVQFFLLLAWLIGLDYNTLLIISSEMILVPYFLIGASLLKIATCPIQGIVGMGTCLYGLWLLCASNPIHLLLSMVLYIPGLVVFICNRNTLN